MQRQFTVNIPDELWVDSWDEELTAAHVYEGPQYFYIALDGNNSIMDIKYGDLETEAESFSDEEIAKYDYTLTIDAEVNPEIAYGLYVHVHDDREFEDVINHDGSIYKKITNPCLRDYFTVDFRSTSEDPSQKEAFLSPIYKDTTNVLHATALERLNIVKKYSDAYDFDVDDQTKIDAFIETMTAYVELVSTAYPWKYITMNTSEVPKVPVALQLLFNQLPEIN